MEVAPVGEGGGLQEVGSEQIHKAAGGVNLAAENVRQRIKAHIAGMSGPNDGVHLQLSLHDGHQLHRVGRVDDQHHALAVRFRPGDHVPLVL